MASTAAVSPARKIHAAGSMKVVDAILEQLPQIMAGMKSIGFLISAFVELSCHHL
jgi:hypothetical protein